MTVLIGDFIRKDCLNSHIRFCYLNSKPVNLIELYDSAIWQVGIIICIYMIYIYFISPGFVNSLYYNNGMPCQLA